MRFLVLLKSIKRPGKLQLSGLRSLSMCRDKGAPLIRPARLIGHLIFCKGT